MDGPRRSPTPAVPLLPSRHPISSSAKALSKYSDMVDTLIRQQLHKLNGASDDARLRLREWELPEVGEAVIQCVGFVFARVQCASQCAWRCAAMLLLLTRRSVPTPIPKHPGAASPGGCQRGGAAGCSAGGAGGDSVGRRVGPPAGGVAADSGEPASWVR